MSAETRPPYASPQIYQKDLINRHQRLQLQPEISGPTLRQIRDAYRQTRAIDPLPLYSIIVPAYNEANLLPQLLAALTTQQTHYPYEIIVVANNCTDQTAQISRACGVRTIEYTSPRYGVAYARQVGLICAQGAIVATTDADAVMVPTWLSTLCRPLLQDPRVAVVTGLVRHYAEATRQPITYLRLYDTVQNVTRRVKCAAGYSERVTLGTNMAFRREQALSVGGYQPQRIIGEDFAMGSALSCYGAVRFTASAAAAVYSSQRRFQGKSLWGILLHDLGGVDRLYGTAASYQMQNIR